MIPRAVRSLLIPLAVLSTVACSKTQDTAPEKRLFGDPPTIQTINKDTFWNPVKQIRCDFSQTVITMICGLGGPSDLVPQKGNGWTHGVVGPVESPDAGVFIEGSYGEANFMAKVTDPDSPPKPEPSNVLLVSASYKHQDSSAETSLVIFDDGSFNRFQNTQKSGNPGKDCEVFPDGTCFCDVASYDVTSGDATANDDTYTRKIALYDPRAEPFLLDCVLRDAHESLIVAPANSTFEFKIEAVDRQGNLFVFPEKLIAVTDTNISQFECTGDSCGCCLIQTGQVTDCSQLPGMIGPSFPDGLCKAF